MIQEIKNQITNRVVDPAVSMVRNLGDVFAVNSSLNADDRDELGICSRILGKICKRIYNTFPRLARAIEHALNPEPKALQRLGELQIPKPATSFIFEILTLPFRSAKDKEKIKKQKEAEEEKLAADKKKEEETRKHIEQQLCQFELPSSMSIDKIREIIAAGKFNQFTLLLQKLKNGGEVTDDDMFLCGMLPIDFNRSFEAIPIKAKLPKKDIGKEPRIT